MTPLESRLTTALADRYRLERELGAGGMATVYLAEDLRHDRKVAIKVLKPELAAVLGAERFVVEIKTTAADYRADCKWSEYRAFCDGFYFAVPLGFPLALLPTDCGLIVADDYGAEVLRRVAPRPMHGSRRRAQTLRLALAAMQRLGRLVDPQTDG